MTLPTARLKPRREASVLAGHPWIFGGALARSPEVEPGSAVDVVDARGEWIGRGFCNPLSQIRVRLATRSREDMLDEGWLYTMLTDAVRRRDALYEQLGAPERSAVRLIASEADRLPGLIVDRYADVIVVQILTAAMQRFRDAVLAWAAALPGVDVVFDRSDEKVRTKEGLLPHTEVVKGVLEPEQIVIDEHALQFSVDLRGGHKTGFYLDQRRNRQHIRELARGRRMLNAFAYTGGFGVAAARGGSPAVVNVDTSRTALELAEKNFALNGIDPAQHEFVEGDCFEYLRHLREGGERFGLIVLDPPKFAGTRGRIDAACRGYKDLALLGLQLLEPGGLLATFSCSGLVDVELFGRVVESAVSDARADVELLARLQQDEDHPVLLGFPESGYLKGLLLRRR